MPVDYGAAQAGITAGMTLPNRHTGLSEMIRTITKDIQTRKKDELTRKQKEEDQRNERAKTGLTALDVLRQMGYHPQKLDVVNSLLKGEDNVDWSGFNKAPSPFEQMGGLMGGGGAGAMQGMRPKGMTIDSSGKPTMSYEAGIPNSEIGKVALANESIKNIDDIIKLLFPDGTPGSFNKLLAGKSNVPMNSFPLLGSVIPQYLPGENSQDIFRKTGAALSGRQLIQTGVAARPEETQKLVNQFAPNLFSSGASSMKGLRELQEFYKNYLSGVNTGQINQGAGGMLGGGEPQIVRTGRDSETGKKVAQLSDGNIVYLE